MNPFAWLVSLALPACGFPAPQGLPTPPVMDAAHIVRPVTPNIVLAVPAGFSPAPDIVGLNRERVAAWLGAPGKTLPPSSER